LGTAAQTTAGMGPAEMGRIAALMGEALRGRDDDTTLDGVRAAVLELCSGFPPYAELAAGGGDGRSGGG